MTLEMNKVIGLTESHQECLRGLLVDPLSMANKMCTYYNGAQGFHDIYICMWQPILLKSLSVECMLTDSTVRKTRPLAKIKNLCLLL